MDLLKNIHNAKEELCGAKVGQSSVIENGYGFVPGMELHNQLVTVRFLTKTMDGYNFCIDMSGEKYVNFSEDSSNIKFMAFIALQLRNRPSLFDYVNGHKEDLYNWFVVSFIYGNNTIPALITPRIFDIILKKEYDNWGGNV